MDALNSNRWSDWRQAFWRTLEDKVFVVPSSDRLFNLYRDSLAGLDVEGAAEIRRTNLAAYLDNFEMRPPWLIVAEAPGPWGCRFTGVPITSESQLADPEFPIHGTPTSADRVKPLREYSAGIFWRTLADIFPNFLVWNTVPLHPHKTNEPLTIRTPTKSETGTGSESLSALYNVLQPDRTFAVGRKAEAALADIGADSEYVRHPSQGGARIFADTMRAAVEENRRLIVRPPWDERK